MFTVCPKCTLTLVVTTVDLRAGQGYVRCGRCANVFNALVALREGEPGGGTSDSAKRRLLETEPNQPVEPALGSGVAMDPEPEPEAQPEPESAPEPAIELLLDPEPEPAPEMLAEESLEFDASSTDVSEIFIEPPAEGEGSGNYETVVLGEEPPAEAASMEAESIEAESIEAKSVEAKSVEEVVLEEPATEEPALDDDAHTQTHTPGGEWSLDDELPEQPYLDEDSASAELPGLSEESSADAESGGAEERTSDPAWVEQMFAEAEAAAETKRQRTGEHAARLAEAPFPEPAPEIAQEPAEDPAHVEPHLEPLLAAPAKVRAPWQYVTGVAVLALVLGAQVIHHHRQALVLNPTFGGAIAKVYGFFGATPAPRWDLTAYTVKQLGAEAEGDEGARLRVRISVQNSSERVQPLPLVRLTLKDRYDNPVATRDLEPREYLPARAADQRLLEPDQRVDAELHVIDPGRAAIGFEIDACLRGPNGAVGCASDARKNSAG